MEYWDYKMTRERRSLLRAWFALFLWDAAAVLNGADLPSFVCGCFSVVGENARLGQVRKVGEDLRIDAQDIQGAKLRRLFPEQCFANFFVKFQFLRHFRHKLCVFFRRARNILAQCSVFVVDSFFRFSFFVKEALEYYHLVLNILCVT